MSSMLISNTEPVQNASKPPSERPYIGVKPMTDER